MTITTAPLYQVFHGSSVVKGCFSAAGAGRMNAHKYKDVNNENLFRNAQPCGDDAQKHTAWTYLLSVQDSSSTFLPKAWIKPWRMSAGRVEDGILQMLPVIQHNYWSSVLKHTERNWIKKLKSLSFNPSEEVKNLWVIFDSNLNFVSHINNNNKDGVLSSEEYC